MSTFTTLRSSLARKVRDPGDLGLKDVAAAFGVSYGTARRWAKLPGFPRAFRAGSRPRWTLDDLIFWALREG